MVSGAKLSAEAEAFLRDHTSIPEVFDGGTTEPPAPPADSAAWTDFLDGGGVLPVMSSVLAFGVGTVIGSEVCHTILELEGCWYFGSEGADPVPEGGHWTFRKEKLTAEAPLADAPAYQYYWQYEESSNFAYKVDGYGGVDNKKEGYGCGYTLTPPSKTAALAIDKSACSGPSVQRVTFQRGSMTNRELQWDSEDNPGVSNATGELYCPSAAPTKCSESPPSNWSERAAGILQTPSTVGLTPGERDKIGEHIAANIPKGKAEGIKDPLAHYVTVPGCSGEAWIGCKEQLEELELVPERSELGWEKAVILDPPNRVEELTPGSGNEVKTGSKVVVLTNPDTEGMPAVIPEISKGETYDEYVAKFSPALDPTREPVSDAASDTSVGPDAALRTDPVEGTRENPAVSTEVTVYTNPKDLPPVAAGGSCNAEVGSVDFSPLNKDLGSKFPFGIVAFFVGWVEEWETSFPTPEFSVHIPHAGTIHINLESASALLVPVRIAIVFAAFIGMIWFLGTAGLKIQGDSSE